MAFREGAGEAGRAPRFASSIDVLRFSEPVLAYNEMCQQFDLPWGPFPPARLIQAVASCSWEQTFLKLARLAALMANTQDGLHDPEVRAWTTDHLERHLRSIEVEERLVAFYVGFNAPRVVANEEVIYFLQSIAVLYGGDSGPTPTDAQVAFWMLAGNDHCFDWRADSEKLSDLGDLAATSARSLLFNRMGDHLPAVVRAAAMFEEAPPRTPEWREAANWRAFQFRAFGVSLDEYFDFLAGALHVLSLEWGTNLAGEGLRNPMLDPQEWVNGTGVSPDLAEQFFERTVASRADLKSLIEPLVHADGLPRGSMAFYLKPFLRMSSGHLVAASPWVIREQSRGGIWARFLAQSKAEDGEKVGGDRWLSAFGDLFELWCRNVARMAADVPTFRGRNLLSKQIGDQDEIEDVVVVDGARVLLASAKARLIRQELLKGALSPAKVLEWFDGFLFGKAAGGHRGGALRLLDQNIERVRAGKHSNKGIPDDAKIFPIVVSFDNLGADNPAFHLWLAERCRAEGVLQQTGVAPAIVLHVEKFEALMAFAAAGGDLFQVLSRTDPAQRADVALYDATEGLETKRLPGIEKKFLAITTRLQDRIAAALAARSKAP